MDPPSPPPRAVAEEPAPPPDGMVEAPPPSVGAYVPSMDDAARSTPSGGRLSTASPVGAPAPEVATTPTAGGGEMAAVAYGEGLDSLVGASSGLPSQAAHDIDASATAVAVAGVLRAASEKATEVEWHDQGLAVDVNVAQTWGEHADDVGQEPRHEALIQEEIPAAAGASELEDAPEKASEAEPPRGQEPTGEDVIDPTREDHVDDEAPEVGLQGVEPVDDDDIDPTRDDVGPGFKRDILTNDYACAASLAGEVEAASDNSDGKPQGHNQATGEGTGPPRREMADEAGQEGHRSDSTTEDVVSAASAVVFAAAAAGVCTDPPLGKGLEAGSPERANDEVVEERQREVTGECDAKLESGSESTMQLWADKRGKGEKLEEGPGVDGGGARGEWGSIGGPSEPIVAERSRSNDRDKERGIVTIKPCGSQVSSHLSTDVSANDAPSKETKSIEGDRTSDDQVLASAAMSRRWCYICHETLLFRSERSAVAGFKMHQQRCSQGKGNHKKESDGPADLPKKRKPAVAVDTPPRRRMRPRSSQTQAKPPATQAKSPPKKYLISHNAIPLYSMAKVAPIPRGDLTTMNKCKLQVLPPDPRPIYGCSWCAIHIKTDDADNQETLCQFCKPLEEKGWFRWIQKEWGKIVYVNERNKHFNSRRAYLEESTKLVGKRLAGMSNKEREGLLGELHVVRTGGSVDVKSPSRKRMPRSKKLRKHAHQPMPPPSNDKVSTKEIKSRKSRRCVATDVEVVKRPSKRPRRSAQLRSTNEGSSDPAPMKGPRGLAAGKKAGGKVVTGIHVLDFARAIASKPGMHMPEDTHLSGHQTHSLNKRRKCVEIGDPRPSLMCNWCGVVPGAKKGADPVGVDCTLCSICRSLQEFGWAETPETIPRQKNFFDASGNKVKGVLGFLRESTDVVREAVKMLSPVERAALWAGGGYGGSDPGDSWQEDEISEDDASDEDDEQQSKDDEPSEDDGAMDDDHISFQSLEEDFSLTGQQKSTLERRKQYVLGEDPRPEPFCEWCGVAQATDSKHPRNLCKICKILQGLGWRSVTYKSSHQQFWSPSGKELRGVKAFLEASTDDLKKAPQTDLSALRSKHDNSAFSGRKAPPLATKGSSRSSKGERTLPKSKNRASAEKLTKSEAEPIIEGPRKTVEHPVTLELPGISHLLDSKAGLSGVLEADVFQVYNSYFGTNANIAARVLLPLGKGQLPPSVSEDTPILRPSHEAQNLPSHASRFVGVQRVKKTFADGKEEVSFGVGMPQFYANSGWSSRIERTQDGHIVPKVATVNGQPLLLRIGIDEEDVAGKLFSFCYRILYGGGALADIVAAQNTENKLSPLDVSDKSDLPDPAPAADPENVPDTLPLKSQLP